VKFTRVGRVHSFLAPDPLPVPPLEPGDPVVVRTSTGPAYATIVRPVPGLASRRRATHGPDEAVLRRATGVDLDAREQLSRRERQAYQLCLMKIRERGLAMKLTSVEQIGDGSRLTFYFTADGRVDFRELVRDLAAEFRTRIEMRQIGVRDEARLLGGYGACGRPLCCTTWLQTFDPVSIRMAKQQKLSLNPSKLSGLCGRLKCCLRYELGGKVAERSDEGSDAGCAGCCGGAGDESGCAGGCGGCGGSG
jgi:cell fate regulator YaaT (PSP1 superfamily)